MILETVTRLLGRPYSLSGVVVDGAKEEERLDFPTANLQLDEPYVSLRMEFMRLKQLFAVKFIKVS